MDWTLRLLLEESRPELSELLGSQRTATIMRELPAQEFTSLSLILPEDCSHSDCLQAVNNCSLSPGDSEVVRLVVRSSPARVWLVDRAHHSAPRANAPEKTPKSQIVQLTVLLHKLFIIGFSMDSSLSSTLHCYFTFFDCHL